MLIVSTKKLSSLLRFYGNRFYHESDVMTTFILRALVERMNTHIADIARSVSTDVVSPAAMT